MANRTLATRRGRLDSYFSISDRGSTVERELRGGLARFFTMAYIVVLNPLIVGTASDLDGNTSGIPKVAAATALVAGVMTILMGVIGRYPFAIATGLGLNAFVAFALASRMSWPDAMGLIVLEGLVISVLVLTFVRRTGTPPVPVELGVGGALHGWPTVVFIVGLLLTTVLVARRVRGAILLLD